MIDIYNNIFEGYKDKKIRIIKILLFIGIMLFGIVSIVSNQKVDENVLFSFILGSLFFYFGLFIGMYLKYFGLIFLFSHSIGGYFFMMNALIGKYFSNPTLTDGNTKNLLFYLYMIAIITIVGFIVTTIYNVNDKYKKRKETTLLPLGFLSIAIFLAELIPFIIDKLI